jgi:N-methylhydantoinase B
VPLTSSATPAVSGTSSPDGVIRNRQFDFSALQPGAWDGRDLPYLPREPLNIDPALVMNTEFDLQVDPITYQVLRSRMWNMNLDHSDTIRRVSGSANIVYMEDFNTSVMTENGDSVVGGPTVQYFIGHSDLAVKWTLEYRSKNPGIEEGDVFLQNDPYIGTEHQMDVMTYVPIFWGGGLFCWILSNCHVGDIGGTDAGSFCIGAQSIYEESTPVPPIKLARRGVVQEDVFEMFIRKSRTPDQLGLQLRSQLAGLRLSQERVYEMLREYGPRVVKGTMRKMIKDCSNAVSRRLLRIPDGRWTESLYIGSAGPDDRDVHRLVTTVEKTGDRLVFTNEGSDEQFYAANAPFSAWRSSLMSAGAALFGYDQFNCPAGVADHMEFRPVAGTLTCARYPAAVSTLTASVVTVYLASQVMSKMALSAPAEVRQAANASGGVSLPGWWVASGLDRKGEFFADLTGDSMNGSIGAFPNRDGIDSGGAWWWPRPNSGNVEEWETAMPIMYLYRREQLDSGGPGMWRGGHGVEIAIKPHKTRETTFQIVSSDPAINTSPGLAGGLPGHPGNFLTVSNPEMRSRLHGGVVPTDRAALENAFGTLTRLSPKSSSTLNQDQVFCVEYSGGGGFGDPFHRSGELVVRDVVEGRVTDDHARTSYGVVITDGVLDAAATGQMRAELRARRLSSAVPPTRPGTGTVPTESVKIVAESFGVSFHGTEPVWACADCGHVLGAATDNYKHGAAMIQQSPYEVDPIAYPDPLDFCDVAFVLRNYLCPACGVYLATECARADDDRLHDVAFSAEGLRTLADATAV